MFPCVVARVHISFLSVVEWCSIIPIHPSSHIYSFVSWWIVSTFWLLQIQVLAIFVSFDCCDKFLWSWWLTNNRNVYFHGLKTRSLRGSCCWSVFLLEALGRSHSLLPPLVVMPVSDAALSSISTLPSLLCISPNSHWPSLTKIHGLAFRAHSGKPEKGLPLKILHILKCSATHGSIRRF